MRAIVYSRVSTDAQERDGTSLDTQERACLKFGQDRSWHVVESIRDTASGYTLDRPGIARLRRLIRDGVVDVVVAYAVDRLARNQTKLAVLLDEAEDAGVRLECVTEKVEDSPLGKLVLSLRAFAAEVEREKIVERTTRGKLERARSGRIPQAMGRGTYGYVYDPKTGKREIEPSQAEVVRRIFRRFAETRSFSAVSNELNDSGIPAHRGGRWYPLTIRNVLRNESYAGRLLFNRTRWEAGRSGANGKRRRRPVARPVDEWIEIEGASPRIVDEPLWQRAQEILGDLSRRPKHTVIRVYPLRSRLKCGVCGSAMVGQTMVSKGREYRYYGCRHIYDRRTGHDCSARYVRADQLELGLWQEVRRVLADPTVILHELSRPYQSETDPAEFERIESRLGSLTDRERRLVKLFSFGEVDEQVVREQMADIRRERDLLQDRLQSLRPAPVALPDGIDEQLLARACRAVEGWLDRADESRRQLALEALQIAIVATREEATVSGVIPVDVPEFFISPRASA